MRDASNYACLSCRQRKLKCDRKHPCANCVARSVSCEQQIFRSNSRKSEVVPPVKNSSLSSLLLRIDQLEAVTNALQHERSISSSAATISKKLNSIKRTSLVPEVVSQLNDHNVVVESTLSSNRALLTNFLSEENPIRSLLVDNISICISKHTLEWKDIHAYAGIHVPPKHDAIHAFELYFNYVGPFQQILYESSAFALVEEVYCHLSYGSTTIAPRGLALILCVIAISVVVEPLQGHNSAANTDFGDRLKLSAVYIRAAMDCLEQQRRRMNHTLESVQAILVLQFLTHHIEIFSYRALFAEAVAISHKLGLHILDMKCLKESISQDGARIISQEMERRVWWYLTATDWIAAMLEGPTKAVYLVSPKLCGTNIPKHLNNPELNNPDSADRPLSEPTSMSYILQRLKLAELARCISETLPIDTRLTSCELIMSLDIKIEALVRELPDFFSFEKASSEEVAFIDQTHRHIPMQRVVLNLMINLIRCQLHFPYISGDTRSPLQTISREAAVKAACKLLDAHQEMATQLTSPSTDFMVQGAAFHLFVGAIIVVMDVVYNQPGSQDREKELTTLLSAFEKLGRVKQQSRPTAILYHKLSCVLTDHGVQTSTQASSCLDGAAATLTNTGDMDQILSQYDSELFSFDDIWVAYMENLPSDITGFC